MPRGLCSSHGAARCARDATAAQRAHIATWLGQLQSRCLPPAHVQPASAARLQASVVRREWNTLRKALPAGIRVSVPVPARAAWTGLHCACITGPRGTHAAAHRRCAGLRVRVAPRLDALHCRRPCRHAVRNQSHAAGAALHAAPHTAVRAPKRVQQCAVRAARVCAWRRGSLCVAGSVLRCGAEWTVATHRYADVIFLFDLQMPSTYPQVRAEPVDS
jgi:hypothetical protein